MKRSHFFAAVFAAMAAAFASAAFAGQHGPGGGGHIGGMRTFGGAGVRMHNPGIVRVRPGNFGVHHSIQLGQNRTKTWNKNWNNGADHGRHHRRGHWRGSSFIALGYPYYYNSYAGSYDCEYYYRRWQEAGRRYWRNRYYDCID